MRLLVLAEDTIEKILCIAPIVNGKAIRNPERLAEGTKQPNADGMKCPRPDSLHIAPSYFETTRPFDHLLR